MEILIGILTIVLVIVSVIMIFVVLMQRGSADGGLGAAMGGGMAESALGAESSSVLSRWTRNIAIVFFLLVLGLYLGRLHVHEQALSQNASALPDMGAAAPATTDSGMALQQLIQNSSEGTADAQSDAASAQPGAVDQAKDASAEQADAAQPATATETPLTEAPAADASATTPPEQK